MRKALVVGIDYYMAFPRLYGCVNDARSVEEVLKVNGDLEASGNFEVKLVTATGAGDTVLRRELWEDIRDLFSDNVEIALLYFAGHGHAETTGGYLLTSDCRSGPEGLGLHEILTLANASRSLSRIVILDSCNSGIAGVPPGMAHAELTEGLTILTASSPEQYATEVKGKGLFTALLVDALTGAAANLRGQITPGSVYAHIDQSLGSFTRQRPMFKTNVKRFVSLRAVQPPLSRPDLLQISELFTTPGAEIQLAPSWEPTSGVAIPEHTRKFALLQKYNRVNLVIPVGASHMYFAAMESKSCKLTALGEHYRDLVAQGRIP